MKCSTRTNWHSTSIAGPTRFSNGWDGWICRFGPPVVRGTCTLPAPLRQRPILFPGGISDIRDSPRYGHALDFEYSIGNVFKYENRLDSAYDYFNRAIAWSRDTTPEMRLLLADVYLEQNKVLDARRTLLKGLSVFKRRKDTAKICGAYLVLRQIEEKAGNREFALVAADSAHRYKDFLTDFVQENLISEIRKDSDNLQLAGERTGCCSKGVICGWFCRFVWRRFWAVFASTSWPSLAATGGFCRPSPTAGVRRTRRSGSACSYRARRSAVSRPN